ncbi:hypothetical protein EJ08DRAFT_620018 [Tothia fuscella]|uniref:Dol-P-Glc:Glc(2)Man(9)GlcNAc(2)-PP-Dol alpha-1,2-glucosyltransferase n=1 Tax=Tothia fuscella TaxID=1048955 RepID=A0A9P4NHF6_9PEZI|nr:hypothetical protein EJ08DRAFT_620018 [Tothia fuscella]
MERNRETDGGSKLPFVLLGAAAVGVASSFWFSLVKDTVPEPYLDEVFHVGQAQRYCAGDFFNWDPKITTPPGLYIFSYAFHKVIGGCDITSLRSINTGALLAAYFISTWILKSLHPTWNKRNLGHTAANIALFPPLFFFSGLYYTDVASVAFVLLAYYRFLKSRERGFGNGFDVLGAIVFGLIALAFRQTNFFWVAVFPAGLAVVGVATNAGVGQEKEDEVEWDGDISLRFEQIFKVAKEKGVVYDPKVENALAEDYAMTALSIAVIAVLKLQRVIPAVFPYTFLIASFGGFVFWNGGVVLGDKSNHEVTLHISQMLYLWPYILFFSFPITIPKVLSILTGTRQTPTSLPRLIAMAIVSFYVAVIVYTNTIVHPFTLADNRHYVFYVFRILMGNPAMKYVAVPVYVVCGYIAIQTLGGYSTSKGEEKRKFNNAIASRLFSFDKSTPVVPERQVESGRSKKQIKREEREKKRIEEEKEKTEEPEALEVQHVGNDSTKVSFVIVWVITTALSLVTAPLVEPRYCILPWIMWRLHVPSTEMKGGSSAESKEESPAEKKEESEEVVPEDGLLQRWLRVLQEDSTRLALETLWFCAVNAGTGYLFLERGFSWEQEPGKVQRFMW